MNSSGDFINTLITVVIIVAVVLGPLVERFLRRMAAKKQEDESGVPPAAEEQAPEPPEPMLPYEDLVNEVFGPYIERKRQEYKAREAVPVRKVAATPVPPSQESEIRIIEESPALPILQAEVPSFPPPRSLDERLFRNPRWSAGARMVIASELLRPPRCLAALRRKAY